MVSLDVKVEHDDKFQLFYINDSLEGGYSINKRLVNSFKGSNDFQPINFKLPSGVLPYKFRIDVGEKGIETLISIRNITLKLNNNVIQINDSAIERFFKPNIYLDKSGNDFIRKKVEGRCDPFFVSTPLLIKKMELEL